MRPPRFSKLRAVELSGKNDVFSRRVLAIGDAFFGPSSIFDPVMRGQMSNFRKIDNFLDLLYYSSKPISHSDL